jgi:hypothetical protein
MRWRVLSYTCSVTSTYVANWCCCFRSAVWKNKSEYTPLLASRCTRTQLDPPGDTIVVVAAYCRIPNNRVLVRNGLTTSQPPSPAGCVLQQTRINESGKGRAVLMPPFHFKSNPRCLIVVLMRVNLCSCAHQPSPAGDDALRWAAHYKCMCRRGFFLNAAHENPQWELARTLTRSLVRTNPECL